ncbi:hypothetical protein VNO78_29022 [Psophocarpus tetragonolobus]|uniref:non-specific serine/threonine protein kinase n=1 Tax=Psophocarpus tetragonolobus TaxID=3891 RepID=A0AAN9RUB8_PSOTE
MLDNSKDSTHLEIFLLFPILILPIVQSLSFNITKFNDTESASIIGYAGVAKTENGTMLLNPLISYGVGRAIYGQPLRFKNSSNGHVTDFSTLFSFTIDVSTTTNYADGFAFYVAPLAYQIPPNSDGASFGLYESTPQSNIVAVEFDTFPNVNFDPPVQHVGINNNSLVSLAYAMFDIGSNIGNMGHVLITYNASAKLLAASWFFEGTSSGFMPNTSVSHQIDLGEILPEWVTIGFSGGTGLSIEKNVIHSWAFSSTLDLNSTHQEMNKENDDIITKDKFQFQVKVVVVAVICSILVMLVVISITWLIISKKRKSDGCFDLDKVSMPRRFGYKELVAATNGFADDRKLGEGGSGQVYKGFLSDLGRVVSDFGMAKLVDPRMRTQKTKVVGTYGYLAPEYINTGRANKESDMYGFGVVALEIACGRKTYKDGEHNYVPLPNWVLKCYVDGSILDAADQGLHGDFDENEMACLLTVGIWCTLHDHKKRPKAEQVINVLKQQAPLPKLSI